MYKKVFLLVLLLVLQVVLAACSGKAPEEIVVQEPAATINAVNEAVGSDLSITPAGATEATAEATKGATEAAADTTEVSSEAPSEGPAKAPVSYGRLALPFASPQADVVVFEEDGRYGMKAAGVTVHDAVWQEISPLPYDNNHYLATMNGLVGVLGTDGSMPLEPAFQSICTADRGDSYCYIFQQNDLYGIMDPDFQVLVEPAWTSVRAADISGYLHVRTENSSDLYSLAQLKTIYSGSGYSMESWRLNGEYLAVATQQYGYYGDQPYILGTANSDYGIMTGALCQWNFQNTFNVAILYEATGTSLYSFKLPSDSSWSGVNRTSYFHIQEAEGGFLLQYLASEYGESYYIIKNNWISYTNGSTHYVLTAVKTYVPFEGETVTVKQRVWGNEKSADDAAYDAMTNISVSLLPGTSTCVTQSGDDEYGKCYLYSLRTGEQLNANSLWRSQLNGIHTKNGVQYLIYDENAHQYQQPPAWVSLNLNTGVIMSMEGVQTISEFSDGMAAVQNSERKWGYIDESGAVVIDFQFEEADPFQDGFATVIKQYKKYKVDKQGNIQ